jgi:cytochrome bd-type quinol oxidase subunit 1
MFTTGQWIFAALFFVAFVIAAYFAYGKDKALHQKVYKGSYKILIGFIVFIILLFVIKFTMKH